MIFDKMKRIKIAARACCTLAGSMYNINLVDVKISFRWIDNHYGRCSFRRIHEAGSYPKMTRPCIHFGLKALLFTPGAFEHILRQTVLHEVAHVVHIRLDEDKYIPEEEWHGEEWREIFTALGGTDRKYFEGGIHYEA